MNNILITGAGGFVGQALVHYLGDYGFRLFGVVRNRSCVGSDELRYQESRIDDISEKTDWEPHLHDINCVVHLAARVHVMHETSADPDSEFRRVNVEGTKRLALQAAKCGIQRFVYISSIKVNGENTAAGAISYDTAPEPCDAYAISKLQSEKELVKISRETGMELVIIRPPLVYGPCVGGNFLKLMTYIYKGWPIPLGRATNRRSMVSVYNLCDLIHICLAHPDASGKTFLVSDDCDISIAALIAQIAENMGKTANLYSFPLSLLRLFGMATGRLSVINRLIEPFEVNVDYTKSTLNWRPKVSMHSALNSTVKWYMDDSTQSKCST